MCLSRFLLILQVSAHNSKLSESCIWCRSTGTHGEECFTAQDKCSSSASRGDPDAAVVFHLVQGVRTELSLGTGAENQPHCVDRMD